MSVGGPASLRLHAWARQVQPFGPCYLVGSATNSKAWRDVDVVCLLSNDEWERLFGPHDGGGQSFNLRWSAMCQAFSLWAEEQTGLPVDFKFQQVDDANARHDGPRHALGLTLVDQPYGREPAPRRPGG